MNGVLNDVLIGVAVWLILTVPTAILVLRFLRAGHSPEIDPQWQRFQRGMDSGKAARRL